MILPVVIRCNLEDEYRLIDQMVNECKLEGVYPPGLLLELVIMSYRGEQHPDFVRFEVVFGDFLTAVTDSLCSSFTDDVWSIGDLPELYNRIVVEIYPEVVKKLYTFGNGFSQDHAVEVDSSKPYYTLIYVEFKNEGVELDPGSLEAVWRNERATSSI